MNLKNLGVLVLVAALGGTAGFASGIFSSKVTLEQVQACIAHPFTQAVGQASQYKEMLGIPENELRQLLNQAGLPEAERLMHDKAITFVYDPANKDAIPAVLAQCLSE